MTSRYYRSGPERAARVQSLFDTVAPRYDLINDVQSLGLHRLWKRRLVRQLNPRPHQLALDLCCGTGDVAFLLQTRGTRVLGVDFSLPMLRVARNRAAAAGARVHFAAGDGLRLPLASASVDLVTISYGLRNLPDFAAGLAEMRRVARPGAVLGILDFGKPPHPLWRRLYFTYLRAVVPWYGRLFCGDPEAYSYILESLHHFPDGPGVSGLLRNAGWSDVCLRPLFGGVMNLHSARNPA